jgi:hypothetical protein
LAGIGGHSFSNPSDIRCAGAKRPLILLPCCLASASPACHTEERVGDSIRRRQLGYLTADELQAAEQIINPMFTRHESKGAPYGDRQMHQVQRSRARRLLGATAILLIGGVIASNISSGADNPMVGSQPRRAPVRVKLRRIHAGLSETYPPDGEGEIWLARLKRALARLRAISSTPRCSNCRLPHCRTVAVQWNTSRSSCEDRTHASRPAPMAR